MTQPGKLAFQAYRKVAPSVVGTVTKRILLRRYDQLKTETEGLLPLVVYRRLYHEVRKLPDLDIVEVGGAAGTASIVMCWALKESGKRSKVVVVEKCEGGTRERYGDRAVNLSRIEGHFEKYGVADQIALYPHWLTFENGEEVLSLVSTPELAAFTCDADGRLHRDFSIFWPRLRTGGLIVVDDYNDGKSWKHVLTFRLLNQLMAWGLFELDRRVNDTMFGHKPAGADIGRLDLELCDGIVTDTLAEWGE